MVSAESSGGIVGEEEMRGLHFKLRLLLAFLPVHIAPGIRYTGWFTLPFDRDTTHLSRGTCEGIPFQISKLTSPVPSPPDPGNLAHIH